MSEQFQNPTEKSLEKVKLIPNTQVHDRSLSELGTGASIKSEMMWSCKCFPLSKMSIITYTNVSGRITLL